MKSIQDFLVRVEHDRRAADRAEELALDLVTIGVEESAGDRRRFAGQDVAEEREHGPDARMPTQNVTGEIVAKLKLATVEITLDQGFARVAGFVPERERLMDACQPGGGFGLVVGRRNDGCGARSLRRWIAVVGSGGQPKALKDVGAAVAEVVAAVREHDEAVTVDPRQADGEASIARAMSRPRREHLCASNFAAEDAGKLAKGECAVGQCRPPLVWRPLPACRDYGETATLGAPVRHAYHRIGTFGDKRAVPIYSAAIPWLAFLVAQMARIWADLCRLRRPPLAAIAL